MPHIIIEHSSNVNAQKVSAVMRPLHDILVEFLPTDLSTCKSRILSHEYYLVGDGDPKNGFIHVEVRILPGRTEEIIHTTAKHILAFLVNYFNGTSDGIAHKISVEIGELSTSYCKAN